MYVSGFINNKHFQIVYSQDMSEYYEKFSNTQCNLKAMIFHFYSPDVCRTISGPTPSVSNSFFSVPLGFYQDPSSLAGCLIPCVFSGEKVVENEAGVKYMMSGTCP